jgi:NAD(P)-dependent dehydrogenase (short-subunit alcohol dehydrogenase family)
MTARLHGKIALILGAGSVGPGWGNGRAMAVRFAEEGAKVFGVDKDLARMTETVERIKAIDGDIEIAQ